MRIAVVFDTPTVDWSPERHAAQMVIDIANQKNVEPEMEYQVAYALQKNGHDVLLLGVHDDLRAVSTRLADWKPDLVFNAIEAFLHNAELDYLIPALLESEGYRYTGAPPLALMVTRNKAMSKKIIAYHGINVPWFRSFRIGERPGKDLAPPFPLIVKPLQADASEGISQASIVRGHDALVDRIAFVHERFGQAAIAEQYIEGRELYATVIGNGDKVEILPIVEMVFDATAQRPEDRIATQQAKWNMRYRERNGIRNVFARPMSKATKEQLATTCLTACRALWLRDYARVDVRLAPDGEIWFIEANVNPFLAYGHDSAEAAHKAGMSYEAFVQRIIDEAMARDP